MRFVTSQPALAIRAITERVYATKLPKQISVVRVNYCCLSRGRVNAVPVANRTLANSALESGLMQLHGIKIDWSQPIRINSMKMPCLQGDLSGISTGHIAVNL